MSGRQCGSFVVVDDSWRDRKKRKRRGNRRTTPTTEKAALTAKQQRFQQPQDRVGKKPKDRRDAMFEEDDIEEVETHGATGGGDDGYNPDADLLNTTTTQEQGAQR
jgi:hypothetical protein